MAQPIQSAGGHVSGDRWLLYGPAPSDADFVLYGFHYAGSGAATTYGAWPRTFAGGVVSPIQPPGRENRITEPAVRSIREYAERVATAIGPFLDRPFAFVGHCGAVTYMAQTIAVLIAEGMPLPCKVFASSWGAPHVRYHGRLHSIAMETIDPVAEVNNACIARLGRTLKPEMAQVAAAALMTDIRLQHTYPLGEVFTFPMPVVAIGWDLDDIVPSAEVWPSAWAECASTVYRHLPGDHWEFMSCPPELLELIATEMDGASLARRAHRDGA